MPAIKGFTDSELLSEVSKMTRDLMQIHGIGNWPFEWDRSKRRLGCAHYYPHQKIGKITISEPLVLACTSMLQLRQTILHEIAHCLDYKERGKSGHDAKWKKIAKSIGCTAKRCCDHNVIDHSRLNYKYKTVCSTCGNTYMFNRLGKYYKPFENSKRGNTWKCNKSCGKCSPGKFDPKYRLTVVQNY